MTFPPRAIQKCRTKLARKKAYFIEVSYVKLYVVIVCSCAKTITKRKLKTKAFVCSR